MAVERIIGIDFGTSTSVIRVKRYQDGRSVGDPLEVRQVTFNMGTSMVPTLVQKGMSGESVYFGHDANIRRKGTITYANFKVKLENPDEGVRRQARELTTEFFSYLAKTYRTQSEEGHLGESGDRERTIVSYPVKWSDETKAFMLETAKKVGFPNVEGLDEAQAAIQAVTVQNVGSLTKKGYFQAGAPVNILLIDMGAGTTDLVLCRHTPGAQPTTEILGTWPQKGNTLFGGREADKLLKSMVVSAMPEDSVDLVLRKISSEVYKSWKESVVSPALERKERVDYFSTLDDLLDALDIEAAYAIDRTSFEKAASDYLRRFPELVNGCLREAKIGGDAVDLVILTGGHSQWYFVREMLLGKMPQFGSIELSKVQREPDRVIPIALPQETVALGLVYGKLAAMPQSSNSTPKQLIHRARKEPSCTAPGNVECWSTEQKPYSWFADAQGLKPLTLKEVWLPALGHVFEWQTRENQRVEVCTRCGKTGRVENVPNNQVGADAKAVVQKNETLDEPLGYTPENEFELGNIGEDYFIRKYIGKREVVFIPPTVRGRKVVSIGRRAFGAGSSLTGNRRLKKVIIPNTIKRIELSAFLNCLNLCEVVAHQNVEYIGGYAFCGCRSLKTMDFGMGVPAPKAVMFPRDLKEIGACAFHNGGSGRLVLTEVTLSKKTKVRNAFGSGKTFDQKYCAVFYYEDD